MNSEIKAIILDLGNYASNEKPQMDEHNAIIPYSLHYTDANLLFSYICELEEENKKLKEVEEEHKKCTRKYWQSKCADYSIKNRLLQFRIDKVIELLQLLIDIDYDYDGFDDVKNLKALIDADVEYARQSIKILKEGEQ